MDAAGLSPFNNHWWHVHDFTPSDAGANWEIISVEETPAKTVLEKLSALGDDYNS
jgi:hypothetical protein